MGRPYPFGCRRASLALPGARAALLLLHRWAPFRSDLRHWALPGAGGRERVRMNGWSAIKNGAAIARFLVTSTTRAGPKSASRPFLVSPISPILFSTAAFVLSKVFLQNIDISEEIPTYQKEGRAREPILTTLSTNMTVPSLPGGRRVSVCRR